ncbi:MAG: JAB domain-containing protein [Bacteroidales bacterium]|nr:JAB domain-containing protein [Candidatus Cacconaster merdequi]
MLKHTLQAVGIRTESDIPASEIFSTEFNPEKYGLKSSALKKISILRDFVAEYNREIPVDRSKPVQNSEQAADLMYDTFRSLDHEEVWVLYLNKSSRPICKVKMGEGSLDAALIDRRKIVRTALEKRASGVILYHNHPSGNPKPSANDVCETKTLRESLQVFDISLLDHVIMTDSKYYAFSGEECKDIRRG